MICTNSSRTDFALADDVVVIGFFGFERVAQRRELEEHSSQWSRSNP
jgi:hypothetical protein